MSPLWTREGREVLFYSPERGIMSVRTQIGDTLVAEPPELLVAADLKWDTQKAYFSASADGELLIFVQAVEATSDGPLVVRTGWRAQLED